MRILTSVAAIFALSTPLLAQEAPLPDYYPAEYSGIVEGSRGEAGVFIYSNISAENWAPALARFAEIYPWIKVETLDLTSSTVHSRYEAEAGTNARTADLMVSASNDRWIVYSQTGEIADYISPERDHLEAFANPVPGVYVMSTDPSVYVYNKLLLDEASVPRGLDALAAAAAADPGTYAGRITSYDATRSSYAVALWWSIMTDMGDRGWELLRAVGPSMKVETSAGQMLEKVAAGEYVYGYALGSSGVFPFVDGAGGELVGWGFPEDGTPMIFRGMGIPAKAQNPNSARLLLDFLLSNEGQTLLGQSGLTPHRPDVDESKVAFTFQMVAEQVGGEENIIQVAFRPAMIDEAESFVAEFGKAVLGN